MSGRLLLSAFVGGILLGVVGWLLWPKLPEPERSAAELMDVVMWGKEPIGGSFALIDHNGQRRTDADFRDKLLMIYFGFTACSDACPTDLQAIAGAVDKLGPTGEAVQPLFITINPELDTPEQLKSYVALFHPRIIGLTGSRRQIADVSRAYKVYFAKTTPGDRTDPNFDHSSLVYVVGTDGKYVGFFPPGTPADRMVEFLQLKLAATTQRRERCHQRRAKLGTRRSAMALTPSLKSSVRRRRVCSASSCSVAILTRSARPARMVARVAIRPSGAFSAISAARFCAAERT